ncbi:uncharacterized protein MONBRDRAFT_21944 [Monosiga brevicollis MX1]|uniref:ubiquitinyl hydrolase 1 n=1 Tax=Monosiga brevicollis TaxID=81824 RepID=A9UP29_MONBE|nr:uncharacterized protein MONBRDRAFT_21944 [Monosiga brevicollis MX1]EDQ92347.1 predicted protein [Monosiga brevicollis MX1]|eukprot:XP_001742109.1 hypothetical protein [Monosiga brevicollis MX1]
MASEASEVGEAAGRPTDEAIMRQMEDIKQEAAQHPLMGERTGIDVLLAEYPDPLFHTKLETLQRRQASFRRTRGDGFLLRLRETYEMALAAGCPEFTTEDFYETVADMVTDLKADEASLTTLLAAVNDEGLSNYLVAYMRIITSAYMQLNADYFQPFIEGGLTVKEYCSISVDPFGVESEHLQAQALISALRLGCRITYIDRSPGAEPPCHVLEGPDGSGQPVCHLMFRPGHYDVLYLPTAAP